MPIPDFFEKIVLALRAPNGTQTITHYYCPTSGAVPAWGRQGKYQQALEKHR